MVSNLLKRCQDDFATVKRQRDGFGAFRKETGCHPASSQALVICYVEFHKSLSERDEITVMKSVSVNN
jgi:hypothetical protein